MNLLFLPVIILLAVVALWVVARLVPYKRTASLLRSVVPNVPSMVGSLPSVSSTPPLDEDDGEMVTQPTNLSVSPVVPPSASASSALRESMVASVSDSQGAYDANSAIDKKAAAAAVARAPLRNRFIPSAQEFVIAE